MVISSRMRWGTRVTGLQPCCPEKSFSAKPSCKKFGNSPHFRICWGLETEYHPDIVQSTAFFWEATKSNIPRNYLTFARACSSSSACRNNFLGNNLNTCNSKPWSVGPLRKLLYIFREVFPGLGRNWPNCLCSWMILHLKIAKDPSLRSTFNPQIRSVVSAFLLFQRGSFLQPSLNSRAHRMVRTARGPPENSQFPSAGHRRLSKKSCLFCPLEVPD